MRDEPDRRRATELTLIAALVLDTQPKREVWPQNSALPCCETAGAAKHLRFHQDLISLAGLSDLAGKTVLDVGSGFGLTLITCALLGASEVHGIEYVPEAVDAVARYLPKLPPDLASHIWNQEGDAAAMPYVDSSFDVVFSIEAISHYADVPAFLHETARVLKPGGALLIADGNNGTNPRVARDVRLVWRGFEQGEPNTRVGDHIVLKSYRDMRRELVASAYPRLEDDELDLLADNTAGFTERETLDAANAYIETGRTPAHSYREGELAMSPSGMAIERLFHPRKLAREIERFGFRARAFGYWGGAGGKSYVRIANRLLMSLSRLTMPLAPAFRIVAERRDT